MRASFTRERILFVCALFLIAAGIFYADYRRSTFFDEEVGFGTYVRHTITSWGEDVDPREQGPRAAFVIDGDTFELASGERVRLIGIDAPESGSPGFSDARRALESLILHKDLRLESDVTDRDTYGRLLRYVWVEDVHINREIVRRGWARSVPFPPDTTRQAEITEAHQRALATGLGMWGVNVTKEGPIVVADFHPNAAGNDNENLNDEYVVLRNVSASKIDVTGWQLTDAHGNEYVFGTYTFNSGAAITLYTGTGEQTPVKLYWGKTKSAVWNNSGDTLFLYNADGELILEYRY